MQLKPDPGNSQKIQAVRKGVSKAVARSLNDAVFEARKAVQQHMKRALDKPTPAVISANLVEKARTDGTLGVREAKARLYLGSPDTDFQRRLNAIGRLQEEGGTLVAADVGRKALAVPKSIRRNQYGSFVKGDLKRLLGQKNVKIVKREEGDVLSGVWRTRRGGKKDLLAWLMPSAHYKPKLRWRATAEEAVRKTLPSLLRQRLSRAGKAGADTLSKVEGGGV